MVPTTETRPALAKLPAWSKRPSTRRLPWTKATGKPRWLKSPVRPMAATAAAWACWPDAVCVARAMTRVRSRLAVATRVVTPVVTRVAVMGATPVVATALRRPRPSARRLGSELRDEGSAGHGLQAGLRRSAVRIHRHGLQAGNQDLHGQGLHDGTPDQDLHGQGLQV